MQVFASPRTYPILPQFVAVKVGPFNDKIVNTARELAGVEAQRINFIKRFIAGVFGVKMRR